ncbi:MAG: hypothetical protein ACOCXJ_00345 [Planctomycetota bacterium]
MIWVEPAAPGSSSSPAERERAKYWIAREAGGLSQKAAEIVDSEERCAAMLQQPLLIGREPVSRGFFRAVRAWQQGRDLSHDDPALVPWGTLERRALKAKKLPDYGPGFRFPDYNRAQDPWADQRPANNLCHIEAQDFCQALRQRWPGLDLRLPWECEWLPSALAGSADAAWWGAWAAQGANDAPLADGCASYGGNSGQDLPPDPIASDCYSAHEWLERQYPHPWAGCGALDRKAAGPWGLRLPGGVLEPTHDLYADPRSQVPTGDPLLPPALLQGLRKEGQRRDRLAKPDWIVDEQPSLPAEVYSRLGFALQAFRGASWQTQAGRLRTARRDGASAGGALPVQGIRLACLPPQSSGRSPAAEPPAPEARLDAAEPHDHQAGGLIEF